MSFVETSREEAHAQMASFLGDETANAVLDLMGGDVSENTVAFR